MNSHDAKELLSDRERRIEAKIKEYSVSDLMDKIDYGSLPSTEDELRRPEDLDYLEIKSSDIVLNPFITILDNSQGDGRTHPKSEQRKLDGYLSTPKFVKYLTDIGDLVSIAPANQRKDVLRAEIQKMNSYLPASVYVPFISSSNRNYAILHVPHKESVVFQTKERAPFMITVEMFRPDELATEEM